MINEGAFCKIPREIMEIKNYGCYHYFDVVCLFFAFYCSSSSYDVSIAHMCELCLLFQD